MDVNDSIKEAREKAGLTQAEAARRLGINRAGLCRLETTKQRPATETLLRLADLYGTTVDALLGRSVESK